MTREGEQTLCLVGHLSKHRSSTHQHSGARRYNGEHVKHCRVCETLAAGVRSLRSRTPLDGDVSRREPPSFSHRCRGWSARDVARPPGLARADGNRSGVGLARSGRGGVPPRSCSTRCRVSWSWPRYLAWRWPPWTMAASSPRPRAAPVSSRHAAWATARCSRPRRSASHSSPMRSSSWSTPACSTSTAPFTNISPAPRPTRRACAGHRPARAHPHQRPSQLAARGGPARARDRAGEDLRVLRRGILLSPAGRGASDGPADRAAPPRGGAAAAGHDGKQLGVAWRLRRPHGRRLRRGWKSRRGLCGDRTGAQR